MTKTMHIAGTLHATLTTERVCDLDGIAVKLYDRDRLVRTAWTGGGWRDGDMEARDLARQYLAQLTRSEASS